MSQKHEKQARLHNHDENCGCFFCRQQMLDIERFLNLTSDLFCQINLERRIQWLNPAMERSLGLTQQELLNTDLLNFVYIEDRPVLTAQLGLLSQYQISPTFELRLVYKCGAFRYYECYIYFDETNKLYCFVARDINENKAMLDKMHRLDAMVEASLDAIYAIDDKGTILSWNNAAEQIFGYSKREIIGQPIYKLAFPEQEDEIDYIIDVISKGETYSYETLRKKKGGETVAVYITLAPIRDLTGTVIGTSAVARGITRYRRLEKEIAQLDKLNTIVELASVISHEVRNPMTTVMGFLQLLYNKIKDNETKEYFEIMLEEMGRVNSILQEFNMIGKNKESVRARYNLNTIIRSLAPLLEADAIFQSKTMVFNLNPIPDLLVDGNEIRQLILNLTRNALEAMDQNGRVTIKTSMADDKVVLSVKDQGKGIASENLEKLGTPFFSTKESGTGLGLYVTYEIVQRHMAHIDVETGPQGTVFSIIFDQSNFEEVKDQ